MLSTCKTPEIKSSNSFIKGCTDKVYNTILYHIYSQTTTGPTFSCARQYQSESLALPWYVLTTAPTVSIRAIEYLFLINHLDLFLNLFDTCPIKTQDVSKGCHYHKNVRKTFRHTCSHTWRTPHVVSDFPRRYHSDLRDWNKTFRRQL